VKLSFGIALKAKWLEQRLLLPQYLFGYKLADSNHLVAMIGVEDHVAILLPDGSFL